MEGKKLVVEFDDKDRKEVHLWKCLCLGMYGKGGIKKRILEHIRKDIKTYNHTKDILAKQK